MDRATRKRREKDKDKRKVVSKKMMGVNGKWYLRRSVGIRYPFRLCRVAPGTGGGTDRDSVNGFTWSGGTIEWVP